jgi:hypothetical protein
MRWKALLVLPMMLSLIACDPDGSDGTVVVRFVCLRINEYDQATQDRALAEYSALPKDSALRIFIGDYKQLRERIRLCRERAAADTKAS